MHERCCDGEKMDAELAAALLAIPGNEPSKAPKVACVYPQQRKGEEDMVAVRTAKDLTA